MGASRITQHHVATPERSSGIRICGGLLVLSGLAAYFTVTRLLESEKWVIHTHEVRAALGDIDSAVLRAGRARSAYAISESDDSWDQFEAAALDIPRALQQLRELTRDNPKQQELCSLLKGASARRVALLQESIRLKKDTPRIGAETN